MAMGQGANAFTTGLQQGYGAVDKALTSKQNRENRQVEAKQMATQRASQIRATQAIENEVYQGDATAVNESTQKAAKSAETAQKQNIKNKANFSMNDYVGSDTPEGSTDSITDMNTMLNNNPDLKQGMGITAPIQELDLSLPKDYNFQVNYLAENGVTPEYLGYDANNPEDMMNFKDDVLGLSPTLSLAKSGEAQLDVEALGNTTGASKSASVKQKKQIEATKEKQRKTVNLARQKQYKKRVDEAAAQLRTAGYNVDTANLRTVEQKEEFLKKAQATIMANSIQSPTKEGADTSGKPQTVSGELAKMDKKQPMDERKMRHLYALAGKTYPKENAKIEQYNFLVDSGLDEETARSWTFEPSKKTSGNTRMDTLQQRKQVEADIASYKTQMKDLDPNSDAYKDLTRNLEISEADLVRRTFGVRESAEEKGLKESSTIRKSLLPLQGVSPYSFEGNSMLSLKDNQDQLHTELSSVEQAKEKKLGDQMRSNFKTVNGVNRFLDTYEDKLKTGQMDRGFISNPVQWAKKFFTDDMSGEQKQKTLDRIKADTTVGIIITEFIKDTTGLAMTEAERKTYNDIIAGGNNADAESLIAAITAFRDSRMATNDTLATQMWNTSPHTATLNRQYNKVKGKTPASYKPSGGGGNTNTTTKSTKTNTPSTSGKSLSDIL